MMCNTSLHTREIDSGFTGFDFLPTRNRLTGQLSKTTTNFDILNAKSNEMGIRQKSSLFIETSKSPILDVTDSSISLTSGASGTDIDMELASNENLSAFRFPGLSSIHGTHLKNNHTLPPIAFSMGVLPLGNNNNSGGPTLFNSNNKSPLPAFEYIASPNHGLSGIEFPLMELNRSVGGMFSGFTQRRPRGEKRPIPDEQKDEKYYERRKRNNEAAKKSRDARKIREDQTVFRAALLEQENSILRAQVLALRDELQTVRQLLALSGRC